MTASEPRLRRPALLLPLVLVSMGWLAGCTAPQEPDTIMMTGLEFAPAVLEVPLGTTVTWKNVDADAHTVTPTNATQWGTPGSGDDLADWLRRGATWQHTFTTEGTYSYRCLPHAHQDGNGAWKGMVGTILVTNTST